MRILHGSDFHGNLNHNFDLNVDLIVHSGDLLPNISQGDRQIELKYQEKWVDANIENFTKLFGKIKVLYVPGNHDYFDPQEKLRSVGIDWMTLIDQSYEFGELKFWGTPWTPIHRKAIWNYKADEEKLWFISEQIIKEEPDVLISHGPPLGILDYVSEGNMGNKRLRTAVDLLAWKLKAVLFGHCHLSPWIKLHNKVLFSNAATTWRIIEI